MVSKARATTESHRIMWLAHVGQALLTQPRPTVIARVCEEHQNRIAQEVQDLGPTALLVLICPRTPPHSLPKVPHLHPSLSLHPRLLAPFHFIDGETGNRETEAN